MLASLAQGSSFVKLVEIMTATVNSQVLYAMSAISSWQREQLCDQAIGHAP
jgi:hypothetical protein